MEHQLVLVLDFGGQANQLVARRVRECGVYCEVHPSRLSIGEIQKKNPIGIILTGGPDSVLEDNAPQLDNKILELGVPLLGIGYGAQWMAASLGGTVRSLGSREHGGISTKLDTACSLFQGLPADSVTWMNHTDCIDKLPEGFVCRATTHATPCAAMENTARKLYGLQFHPEVSHTNGGTQILRNFLTKICGATGDWTMRDYATAVIEDIRATVKDGKVLLALSGGVDSSVCAALLSKAIGNQLTCIFVDHGLMRKNEGNEVVNAFADRDIHLIHVNAEQRFLQKLSGVTDPERKRKIIGEEFIRVFEEEAKKLGAVDYLAQGTIYPDVIESGIGAAVVKSHHNVGGLPDYVDFKEIIEPLRPLFKAEVRSLGHELGLPDYLVQRQPFPGPGLAVRVIGEVTKPKLDLLRDADYIFREEIAGAGLAGEIQQYFAVLTDMRSVGVVGDERTYDYILALRAITTTDFMTADWARIPHDVLEKASSRIAAEVRGISRIVYDITPKPPATIEWE